MKKSVRYILLAAALYLAAAVIMDSKTAVDAGRDAVLLCANTVVPALFPYMVCSGILARSDFSTILSRYLSPIMRPLFNLPGSSAITFILGCISGYPIGAISATDLYSSGECSKNEAERLVAFCNNSGPLFIVSIVGESILGDPDIGKLLYISHIFAAVLTGIILRSFSTPPSNTPRLLSKSTSFKTEKPLLSIGAVVDSSVFNILKICGFVILFSVFAKMLPDFRLRPFVHSVLEITGGTKALANTDISFSLKVSLISFFVSFSGISVFLQVEALTSKAGLSLKPYFFGKLVQATLSFVITKILVSKLPPTASTFAKSTAIKAVCSPCDAFVSSLFMIMFGIFVLVVLFAVAKSATRHQKSLRR